MVFIAVDGLFYFTGTSIRKRKQYSDDTKRAVYAMLLEGSVQGHLPEGVSLHVSLAMDVSLRCVQRIWNEGQKGGGIHAVVNKRVGHCGRKRIELPMEAITAIPFQDRTTLEDLARRLGVSKSHVHKHLKEGKIERHSSGIKPFLTDENKKARVQHALNMLEPSTIPHQPVFKHMYNVIHAGLRIIDRRSDASRVACQVDRCHTCGCRARRASEAQAPLAARAAGR